MFFSTASKPIPINQNMNTQTSLQPLDDIEILSSRALFPLILSKVCLDLISTFPCEAVLDVNTFVDYQNPYQQYGKHSLAEDEMTVRLFKSRDAAEHDAAEASVRLRHHANYTTCWNAARGTLLFLLNHNLISTPAGSEFISGEGRHRYVMEKVTLTPEGYTFLFKDHAAELSRIVDILVSSDPAAVEPSALLKKQQGGFLNIADILQYGSRFADTLPGKLVSKCAEEAIAIGFRSVLGLSV